MLDVLKSAPKEQGQAGQLERKAQLDRIDDLLAQYLDQVHQYRVLQTQLGNSLSFGFLSLAQANFTNTTGLRYGQIHYDERAQATLTVAFSESLQGGSTSAPTITIRDSLQRAPSQSFDQTDPSSTLISKKDSLNGLSNDPASTPALNPDPKFDTPEQVSSAPTDPLRQFSLLPSQSLRTAQTHFREAVLGHIAQLAVLQRSLRSLEVEIARARKELRRL